MNRDEIRESCENLYRELYNITKACDKICSNLQTSMMELSGVRYMALNGNNEAKKEYAESAAQYLTEAELEIAGTSKKVAESQRRMKRILKQVEEATV